ncbi:MAG: MFS transporter [Bacillota bacterium]
MNNNTNNKLPKSIQIFYGIGVSYAIVDQIFAQWVLYYYLPPEASQLSPVLPPVLISLALIISRFVDMIADPAIGYLSDKTRTKFGRRIPFIAIGVLPLAITTVAFFYPPGLINQQLRFIYLAVIGALFFIFYTIVGAPYNALIPDLAQNKTDRLNLSTWQSVFRLFYTAIAMILPGWLIVAFGQGNEETGIRRMVILLSTIMIIGIIITIAKINENKYSKPASTSIKITKALKLIINNRSTLFYFAGLTLFFLGFNTLRGSINYYVIDIMGYGPSAITLASALLFGSAALAFYPVNRLANKIGYKKPLLGFLIILIILSLALTRVGQLLNSDAGFIIFFLFGIPISGAAFIFPPAMLSELASKLQTEKKVSVEGLFFGIQGFFLKLAFLLSIGILPLLLVSGGSDFSLAGALIGDIDQVTQSGIYGTSYLAAIVFACSFLCYLGYKEN